jgi:TATA-box binding protein (TBP) (component of TFIID and TFIIIB)
MKEEKFETEPKIEITNIVAHASLGHRIDLSKIQKCWQQLEKRGLSVAGEKPNPYLKMYLKNPQKDTVAVVCLAGNGALKCFKCKSQGEIREAVRKTINILNEEGLLPESTEPEIKIANVCCSAYLGKTIGCGIIQKAFPEAKKSKFGGESFVVPLEEGTIKIFPSGRIVGVGFQSEEKTTETVNKTFETLSSALERYDTERAETCKIERLEPTIEILRDCAGKEETKKEWSIAEGVLEEAELLIIQFYKARMGDSLGAFKVAIAAGAFYIAELRLFNQELIRKHHTQKEVGEIFQIVEAQARKGFKVIKKTLIANGHDLY